MLQGAVLYAKDLDRQVTFYATFGGQIVEQQAGDYAVIEDGNSQFALVQIPPQIAAAIEITSPPAIRAQTPIKLIFVVASIDEALSAAAKLGGTTAPDAQPWQFRGHEVQDAIDPEGNVYQLWQPSLRE